MTDFKVNSQMKAVLVIENGTCRMLNASDKDPSTIFVILPEGGHRTIAEVLWDCEGDYLTPQAQLLTASIDAMLAAAYQSGIAQGRTLTKGKGLDGAGKRRGVKMYG